MGIQPAVTRKPLARAELAAPVRDQLWAIVLAGGEGVRLKPLTYRICGDYRPKQYVPVFGGRSFLNQTLDRVGLVVPRTRTAVVTLRSHSQYFCRPGITVGRSGWRCRGQTSRQREARTGRKRCANPAEEREAPPD